MVWEWYLPAFMTLAGIGAFLYLFGVWLGHREIFAPPAKFATYLSWMVLALAGVFVLLDLGKPAAAGTGIVHILNVFNRWPSSPISFETSMLLATLGFGLLCTLFYLAGWRRGWPRSVVEILGAIPAMILAFGYAGFLELGAFTTNPLWHTVMLSLLTLSLAIAAAAAVINLPNVGFFADLLPNFASKEAAGLLGLITRSFLVIALILTPLYLLTTGGYASLLLGGSAGVKFWGALVLGIVVPLVIGFSRGIPQEQAKWVALAQIVLVVFGTYLFNLAVLQAGQLLL
ncbi:MAG TPA: hypothetical protein GXX19_02845 [Syntrophomonadaceae bacterium]|nr:hypothetical protein [Syntrophomonadaceae bacterium]